MSLRCPHCEAQVYSRRNVLCSVCHRPLPVEMIMSAEEKEAVEAAEKARAEQARLREESRREAARKAASEAGGF